MALIKAHRKWNPRFHKLSEMSHRMGVPEGVLPFLLQTFTAKQTISEERHRFVMNSNHKIKLLNYVFVCHLVLSGYTMKLSELMRELQMDIRTTRMHAIKVGCTVHGGGKTPQRNSTDFEGDAFAVPEMTASLNLPFSVAEMTGRRERR